EAPGWEIGSELSRAARIDDAALFDFVEQRLVADLQLAGGLALVPGGALEHRENRLPLRQHRGALSDVLERHLGLGHPRRGRRRLRDRERMVTLPGGMGSVARVVPSAWRRGHPGRPGAAAQLLEHQQWIV